MNSSIQAREIMIASFFSTIGQPRSIKLLNLHGSVALAQNNSFKNIIDFMGKITVAAVQFPCSWEIESNLKKAEILIRQAARQGAQIILLQELFQTPYFCQEQNPDHFKLAAPLHDNPLIQRFVKLAIELNVVLPISFFESSGLVYFNSIAIIDADGSIAGHYRKSHIPDGPGYFEKFYFSPGDTGFKVFQTKFGKLGVLICWDQWFPEAARACALLGADILLYPTAIGSEPRDPSYNSYPHWVRVMQGHAAANMIPVVASNRIGREDFGESSITFYGGSFIAGSTGEVLAQVGGQLDGVSGAGDPSPDIKSEGFVLASFDWDKLRQQRIGWGIFRDRRPDVYGKVLSSLDGCFKISI